MKRVIFLILVLLLAGCSKPSAQQPPDQPPASQQQQEDVSSGQQPDQQPQDDPQEEDLPDIFKNIFFEADIVYFVQYEDETQIRGNHDPALQLEKNGNFKLMVNLYAGMGFMRGSYTEQDNLLTFTVDGTNYMGFVGDDASSFTMLYEQYTLTITLAVSGWDNSLGATTEVGSVFYLATKPSNFDSNDRW